VVKSPRSNCYRTEHIISDQITTSKGSSRTASFVRDRRQDIDLAKAIQQAKDEEIEQMHVKLRELEKERMAMQIKLAVREN
jgi:hypothetical protein